MKLKYGLQFFGFLIFAIACSKETQLPDIKENKYYITNLPDTLVFENLTLNWPVQIIDSNKEIFISKKNIKDYFPSSDSIHFIRDLICILPENMKFTKPAGLSISEDLNWFYVIDPDGFEIKVPPDKLSIFEVDPIHLTYQPLITNRKIQSDKIVLSSEIQNAGYYQIGVPDTCIDYWGGYMSVSIQTIFFPFSVWYEYNSNSGVKTFIGTYPTPLSDKKRTNIQLTTQLTDSYPWFAYFKIYTNANPQIGIDSVYTDEFNHFEGEFYSYYKTPFAIESQKNSLMTVEFTQFGKIGEYIEGIIRGYCLYKEKNGNIYNNRFTEIYFRIKRTS